MDADAKINALFVAINIGVAYLMFSMGGVAGVIWGVVNVSCAIYWIGQTVKQFKK